MSKTEPKTLLFHGDLRATLGGECRVSVLGHEAHAHARLFDSFVALLLILRRSFLCTLLFCSS